MQTKLKVGKCRQNNHPLLISCRAASDVTRRPECDSVGESLSVSLSLVHTVPKIEMLSVSLLFTTHLTGSCSQKDVNPPLWSPIKETSPSLRINFYCSVLCNYFYMLGIHKSRRRHKDKEDRKAWQSDILGVFQMQLLLCPHFASFLFLSHLSRNLSRLLSDLFTVGLGTTNCFWRQ